MKRFAVVVPLALCACLDHPATPFVDSYAFGHGGAVLTFGPSRSTPTSSLCFPHRWVMQPAGSCASSSVTKAHPGGWDQPTHRFVPRLEVPEIDDYSR